LVAQKAKEKFGKAKEGLFQRVKDLFARDRAKPDSAKGGPSPGRDDADEPEKE